MSDTRPIGVFDSGLGGLTVVNELFRLLPSERVLYLGDTARFPYGNRSDATIQQFGIQDARFLLAKNIKMLVVACNTVSSVALEHVRQSIVDIPIIGVVLPGARAAVTRTASRKVGVVGTHATIRTQSYPDAIHHIDARVKVFGKACPLFAPMVEEGLVDSDITRLTAQYYLYELVDAGIDCLILGCTHYPLLLDVIQETVGSSVHILDSAHWAAKEACDILSSLDALAPADAAGAAQSVYYVTDLTPSFKEKASRFLGRELPNVETIHLEELTQTTGK
jgi:glutamate racemase